MENIINKIIKISLYLLVFLLPLFFLPLTVFPVAWNKQFLLAAVCFLVSVLWLIKIIKFEKIDLVWNKLSWAVLILLAAVGISTIFSMAKAQSFWGTSVEADTLFNFVLYGLTFFLFSNLVSKKEVIQVIKIFLLSSGILALIFLIKGFNSIGSAYTLAVFFGGAFVVLITLIITDKKNKTESLLAWVIGGLLFVSILLINFHMVWLGIVFAMVMVLRIKPKSLPLLIFAIALLLIFIRLPLGDILKLPAEINPTYKASFNIAKKTIGEGFENFVFGSGPSTFVYKYSLHRSTGPNLTSFWNLRFEQAPSVLITFLTISGILGILAVLFLIITFFYHGFKSLSKNGIEIVVFAGGAYFLILWIFYSINFSLMFAGFLMLGLWLALTNKSREISLVNPPQKAFLSMLGAAILIVILIAGFYIYIQKYSAALSFAKGLDLLNSDLNKAIININKAGNLAKTNDRYFRNLSQAFLLKISEVLNNQAELQEHISNVQKVVQKTIETNPKNSLNWAQAGRIYENLILLEEGAGQKAIIAYQKAAELDPKNPQISFNLGRVYKTIAQRIQQKETYIQALELAIDNFQKSIELKFNFTPAYYLLAQVYEMKGEKELAIKNYQMVLQLDPGNKEAEDRMEKLGE